MFLGLRTVVYSAGDLDRARDWFTKVLEKPPYFSEPFYVGFNVGGYELGLDPDAPPRRGEGPGAVAYWGVGSLDAALSRILTLGAKKLTDARDVGGGIRVATVEDPFGNVVGLIENPHFSLAE